MFNGVDIMAGAVMRADGAREDEWSLTLIANAELERKRPLLPLNLLSTEEKHRGHGLLLPWVSASLSNALFIRQKKLVTW